MKSNYAYVVWTIVILLFIVSFVASVWLSVLIDAWYLGLVIFWGSLSIFLSVVPGMKK